MSKKIIIYFLFIIFGLIFSYLHFKLLEGGKALNNNSVKNEPAGWLKYHNPDQSFSLAYPPELLVKEYDEGDGTKTIIFEGRNQKRGFQVFFTPYLGESITSSRILRDIPSGNFTEPAEVILDDQVRGLIFFSQQIGGQMREVWFLHNGYLFEVTAVASLDQWLSDILSTWHFN
ncbi:MAG: hypothetical protein AAB455_01760 [Patescibacteria group bacterium]